MRLVTVGAFLTVLVLGRTAPATAVNVLAIEPLPARSHWTFMRAVLQALATVGGHNVTVYTPFAKSPAAAAVDAVCDRSSDVPSGCGYVELPLRLDVPDKVSLDLRTAIADFGDVWRFIGIAVNKSRTACDRIDRLAAAGHFADDRYDLVVIELISSECVSRVATGGALADVPLVYVFPSPMASWMEAKALGTRPGPSYAARLFARFAVPDTLARRLDNAYGWAVTEVLQWYHGSGDDETRFRKPDVTFVNSDPTVEKSVPVPPNMIHIGGVHLAPAEPIPSVSRIKYARDNCLIDFFFFFLTSFTIMYMFFNNKGNRSFPQKSQLVYANDRFMEFSVPSAIVNKYGSIDHI